MKHKKGHLKNTIKESFRMALEAIRANKLRSSLTLLGISIGVFSVIGVMTAIRTLESSVESGLNVFGTNTFTIQKYPAIQMGGHSRRQYRNRDNLDYYQYEELKRRAKLPLSVSSTTSKRGIKVTYREHQAKKNVFIMGGDEGTLRTFNTTIGDGRNITSQDVKFSRMVAVLGADAMDQLFPFEDPLGKIISIKGMNFSVIGTADKKGEMFGQSQDNYVMIPITTFLQRHANRWTSLGITVEARSEEMYEKTMDETIGLMRAIRKVPPGEDNDFEVVSNAELLDTFAQFTGGIKLFAFAVSVIALLVAGIGIMNIMLVSVTERIKEIGIRKAIGATRRDILIQFLSEAVFLSEFGGIVGVILGVAGGNAVAMIFHIPAVIPLDWAVIGLVVCSVIGIGFGIYPAWRAAKMDPIESLRYE
ncbi:MAG: ABC transporter permease [Candidatus Marinimicrobia bacterium]|nr:ABC transporter permease [Candidatus Neomarinimicrobiota bacterium]